MVTNPDGRRAVIAAIKSAGRDNPPMKSCFIPRHSIRVVRSGDATEMLICFQCHTFEFYRNGERLPGHGISSSAEPLLDRILTDANVPLAPKSLK